MRTPFRWLVLVLFIVLNGVILYWAWDRSRDPAAPVGETKAEASRRYSELEGRTDSLAYDLIAKWNRDPVVDLDSEELASAVESLPEANCIGLPSGAIAIDSSSLPAAVRQDLNAAVTGLFRAYRENTPDALIQYMRARGMTVNPDRRKFRERALIKSGVPDVEKLSDEEQFRTGWTTSKTEYDSHWSGLVVESSCRQFWDGKTVPLKRLRFDINSAPDTPPGQLEQAAFLMRLLRGTSSGGSNFRSTVGSLQDAWQNDPRVLLCDVQLVVELDDVYARVKAAYLLRFWFNPRLEKWQPQAKRGYSTDPGELRLPITMF